MLMPASDEILMAVRAAMAEQIGSDVYDCTRVWEAWSYGTMRPDDFCPVHDNDERMHELAGMVTLTLANLPADSTSVQIQEAVHDKVAETLGEVYFNDQDMEVQDNFYRITDDANWTQEVARRGLVQAAGFTQHAELVGDLVEALRQDEAWPDLADLAAAYRQPASLAWLQEAADHLGDHLRPGHQDLLRSLARQEALQAKPAATSTGRSPMRRRS